MSTIGITSPPVSGHMNPMLALGAELVRRGHRVVVMNVPDTAAAAQRSGLEHASLGAGAYPPGWLPGLLKQLASSNGAQAAWIMVKTGLGLAGIYFDEAREAIAAHGIDALLVDQAELLGPSVAEVTGLPYVTVANALPVLSEPTVPPVSTAWRPRAGRLFRWRNVIQYWLEDQLTRPMASSINDRRRRWGLSPRKHGYESLSPLAQVSQCPVTFDYPRARLPPTWHGVGPLRNPSIESHTPFPFERLDGRPLVYASLGTQQGARRDLFAAIAEAMAPLRVQLVLSHAHSLRADETQGFAGDPIVVPYAPQAELLARAKLVITHAGMNTMLDSLAAGVPAVAVPIAFEQPAIAARLAFRGAGEVVPLGRARAEAIRAAAKRVLDDPAYRRNALVIRDEIAAAGGVKRAADVVEQAFRTRAPVFAAR